MTEEVDVVVVQELHHVAQELLHHGEMKYGARMRFVV